MDENAEKSKETAVKNDDLITDFGRRTRTDSLSSKNQSDDEQNESIPQETNKDNNTIAEEEGRKTLVEGDDGDDDILLRAQAIAMAVSSSASKLSAEEAKKTLAQKQDSNQKKFLQEIEHKKKKQQQQAPAWLSNVQNFQSMISSSMQTATSPSGAGTTNTNTNATSINSGKNENSLASITSSSGIFGKQHQFRWPGQSDKSTATATVPMTVSNVEKETPVSTGQQDTSNQPKSTNNVSTEEENNNKKSRNSSSKNPLNNIKEDSLKTLKDSMNIFKIPKFGEESASASTSVPTKTIHNEKEFTKKEDVTSTPPTQTSEKVQTRRSISPVPADRLKKSKENSVPSSPSKISQPSQDKMESTNVVATTTTTTTVINRKSKKTSNSYSCLPSNSALGDVVTSPTDLQQTKSQEMSSSTSDETVILLEGSVWKRRSGLGKLSTHAWEKRKLILQGTKLTYFSLDKEQAQVDKTSSASPTTIEKHEPRPWEPATVPTTTTTTATKPNKAPSIWEQAAANFEKAQENFNKSINSLNMTLPSSSSISSPFTTNTGSSSSSGNTSSSMDPRGSLDIIKEKASVCASSGHSGAPTPFAISIKVGMETKWKLCFKSQEEQRKWLDVLGDIVIKNSVDLHHENHWKIKSTTTRKTTSPTGTGSVSSNNHNKDENEKLSSSSTDGQKLHPSTAAERRGNARGHLVESRGKSRRSLHVLQRGFSQNIIQTDHLEFHLEEDEILAFLTAVNIALIVSKVVGIFSFILLLVSINICLACWCNLVPEDFLQKILSYLTEKENNKKTTKTSSNSEVSSRKVKKAKLDKKKKKDVDKDIAKKKSDDDDKEDKEEEENKTTIQPKAGSTTYHVSETPTSPDTRAGIPPAWRNIPASSLAVRGPGYGSNKTKIPSPGELYECVGVDVIDSSMRVSEIADKVNLSHWFNDDEKKDNAVTNNKPWSAPDIFIVNVAVPTEAPKLTRSETDGQTINVVMYLKMTAQTRKILELSYSSSSPSLDDSNNNDDGLEEETSKRNNNSLVNGVKLFDQWCKKSPTDPKFQARFKLVPNMLNLVEIGLPSYIAKYNSKPVLIKRNGVTGFLSSHKPSMNKPNENNNNNNNFTVMEFGISLHPFPYIAKQAFSYLNENYFAKIVANIGVVIEGRAEDELPEVVIGCMQLCYPDTKAAIKDQDWFFSGKGVEEDLVDSTNCDDEEETQKKKVIVKQEEVPSPTHA